MNTATRLQIEELQVVQHNYFIPSSSWGITLSLHSFAVYYKETSMA